MTPLETAYHQALDELSAAHADTLHLHDEPPRHPLAPAPLSRDAAIALLRAAAGRERWIVVFDGGTYVISTEEDLYCYRPDAAQVARSHCAGCGDVMTEDLQRYCAACREDEGWRMDVAA